MLRLTRDLLRVGSSRESSPGYARALQQQLQLHPNENGSKDMDIDQPGRLINGAEACGVLGQGAESPCARNERRERCHDCGGFSRLSAHSLEEQVQRC